MNSKKKIYHAVIIGTGQIASGFDTPRSRNVLTHAHALTKHPRIKLVGMMDVDFKKGKNEARKWKTKFYPDIESMLEDEKPDIVAITTPDDTHKKILLSVMRTSPGLIILEKPIVKKKQEITEVKKALGKYPVPIIVNFRRRFDSTVSTLREEFLSGVHGKILSANASYSKGTMHTASHAIDLARYLFGDMRSSIMSFRVNDFTHDDPSVGGVMTFERCPQFYLMNGDERCFSLFEFEILTEKGRLRFIDEGFSLITQEIIPDPIFKGYRILGSPKIQKTKLINAMPSLIEHAVMVLDGKEVIRSTVEDAIATQEACFILKG